MQDQAGQYAVYPTLRGKLVVVTGGASGIGAAIVEGFAQQGARVVFLDLDRDAGEVLVARLDLTAVGFRACDLADIAALQSTMAAVIEEHGAVDVLVNNAGNDTRHEVAEVTPASWDQSIAVNLKHQFFMCQAVLPGMRQQGHGSIINMSSIGWIIPSTSLPIYVTAKAGIVGMTRTLAHEVGADNIRVNCILPGAIETARQRQLWYTEEYMAQIMKAQALKRTILPEDVARLTLFLAAEDSSAITGQSHVIDGGWV